MKTLSILFLTFYAVTIFSLGHAMEPEENAPLEQDHWSTKEIQSPLKLMQKEYPLFLLLEPTPYTFINTTQNDLYLSFYYQLESSNDPNLNFDKLSLTDIFGDTYDYENGKLIDGIEIKANSEPHYSTTYEDWHKIERRIEKILIKKKDYSRFKFTLEIKCSNIYNSTWMDYSCPGFPILSLSTDKASLAYHYQNHFYSIFAIIQKPRQNDCLESQLTFHIKNHVTRDHLFSNNYSKSSPSMVPLFNWPLKTPNGSGGEIHVNCSQMYGL